MTNDDIVTLLRSKSALGRLGHSEVDGVLTFLESIGADFSKLADPTAPAPVVVAPVTTATLTPVTAQAAQVAQVLPAAPVAPPAPLSTLASLEATIEKDVAAFFHPAPPAAVPVVVAPPAVPAAS